MRKRYLVLLVLPLLLLGCLFMLDVDGGAVTAVWAIEMLKGVFAVSLALLAVKAVHDYDEADSQVLFRMARNGSSSAGMALIAKSIVLFGLLMVFNGGVRAEIPKNAHKYLPLLEVTSKQLFAAHPDAPVLAGMVHQETCAGRDSPRCWSPLARLRSPREEGAGFGQLTRTFTSTGQIRFDALAEMKAKHKELAQLSWANIYDRPDLQMVALVLKSRDDYQVFSSVKDTKERLVFQVAAYNRGVGGVQSERRACKLKPGCDPDKWFGHVETTCTASRAPIYGNRSACDINRQHVRNVLFKHTPIYRG